jgi:cobalamin biosynthetic protein CobC
VLEHGGRRRAAAARYGIAEADWLDLSTGINPNGYPVPTIPPEDWLRLPEDDDGLLDAAAACYGTPRLVALAGSQPAIQTLPFLLPRGRVAVLAPTYAEHPHHWELAGHRVARVDAGALFPVADEVDTVVVCHPNNPDATRFAPAVLVEAAERLARRGGHLIVDEAFIDATPDDSIVMLAGGRLPGLIVLRSLGKFFGLAGARVGFVAAAPTILSALAEAAGPWPLCGPARRVARAALSDVSWQRCTRRELASASARLADQVAALAPGSALATHPLFVWLPTPHAAAIAGRLAERGILVRCFDAPGGTGLRVGLPACETEWQRLGAGIKAVSAPPHLPGSSS